MKISTSFAKIESKRQPINASLSSSNESTSSQSSMSMLERNLGDIENVIPFYAKEVCSIPNKPLCHKNEHFLSQNSTLDPESNTLSEFTLFSEQASHLCVLQCSDLEEMPTLKELASKKINKALSHSAEHSLSNEIYNWRYLEREGSYPREGKEKVLSFFTSAQDGSFNQTDPHMRMPGKKENMKFTSTKHLRNFERIKRRKTSF